jgi:hypothetical protein
MLRYTGCKFLLAHNYGLLELNKSYVQLIDANNTFLNDTDSLTKLLSGSEWSDNYNKSMQHDGPTEEVFVGKYFEGNSSHPNQLGHQRIFEMLIERMNLNAK